MSLFYPKREEDDEVKIYMMKPEKDAMVIIMDAKN